METYILNEAEIVKKKKAHRTKLQIRSLSVIKSLNESCFVHIVLLTLDQSKTYSDCVLYL